MAAVAKAWAISAADKKHQIQRHFLESPFNIALLDTNTLYTPRELERCVSHAVKTSEPAWQDPSHPLHELAHWWHKIQFLLHIKTRRTHISFEDILSLCWIYWDYQHIYPLAMVKDVFKEFEQIRFLNGRPFYNVNIKHSMHYMLFTENQVVHMRNLRCPKLGKSVYEVCVTLLILIGQGHCIWKPPPGHQMTTLCSTWCQCRTDRRDMTPLHFATSNI